MAQGTGDEFDLDFEDDAPRTSNAEAAPGTLQQQQAAAAEEVPFKPKPAAKAANLIAMDPEKTRIVGFKPVARAHEAEHSASDSGTGVPLPDANGGSSTPSPSQPVFEGQGLQEVGTLKKAAAVVEDDEFDYVFQGGKREGEFHKQVFKPKAMPAHLVSNVKQKLNTEVLEEEEDEDEEGDEDENDEPIVGSSMCMGQSMEIPTQSEMMATDDVDASIPPGVKEAAKHAGAAGTSWTTFTPTETTAFDQLPDDAGASHEANNQAVSAAGTTGHAAGAGMANGTQVSAQEDLPSYKLIQALSNQDRTSGPASGDTGQAGRTPPAGPSWGREHRTGEGHEFVNETPMTGGTGTTGISHVRSKPQQRVPRPGSGVGAGAVASEPDEWELANQERLREMGERVSAVASGSGSVSYHEALLHFMTMDCGPHRASVQASLVPAPGLFSRMLCLGPPALRLPLLHEQLLQLLSLARVPFSDSEPMHMRLLCSLYAAFTGKSVDQPRTGDHWADLGFQGQDPATDLRGCGMLGLLQLYYLHQWDAANAERMYRLSRHPVHEFPLAIVSLNITKWTLQALREGSLSKQANTCGSMVEAAMHFYTGTFVKFYGLWLGGRKTMRESGYVLKEVEGLAKKKAGLMCKLAEGAVLEEPLVGGH